MVGFKGEGNGLGNDPRNGLENVLVSKERANGKMGGVSEGK